MADEERATLWNGCLGPIVRAWLSTAGAFVVAVTLALFFGSWWWFFGAMFASAVILELIDRRYWKSRDDRLRRRFFGLHR